MRFIIPGPEFFFIKTDPMSTSWGLKHKNIKLIKPILFLQNKIFVPFSPHCELNSRIEAGLEYTVEEFYNSLKKEKFANFRFLQKFAEKIIISKYYEILQNSPTKKKNHLNSSIVIKKIAWQSMFECFIYESLKKSD